MRTHRPPIIGALTLTGLTLLGHLGCDLGPIRHLDPDLVWVGDNRERLDAMMDELSPKNGEGADAPVAIFDWDNTVIKNDVGDAVLFWMLRHDKVLQPPTWAATSPLLTPAAAAALTSACASIAAPGEPLATSRPENAACADEIVTVYTTAATTAGDAAFAGWDYRTMEPAYAWLTQLQGGHSYADLRGFADAAIDEALAAEIGATQTIGTTAGISAWLRVYPQIEDLIGALQDNKFDVWVLSASSQPVVEAFAARVGVRPTHVIGIRAVLKDGKATYDLQGCGSVPDGANTMITYIEGKRCWMNQEIFGIEGAAAEEVQNEKKKRPVFGAGDSDTDVSFMQDATALRLALNRNKKELMCNAYADAGGRWLVNPMFIEPKDQLTAGYACSVDACRASDGAKVPCVDEAGATIPDQADTVFCRGGVYCEQ